MTASPPITLRWSFFMAECYRKTECRPGEHYAVTLGTCLTWASRRRAALLLGGRSLLVPTGQPASSRIPAIQSPARIVDRSLARPLDRGEPKSGWGKGNDRRPASGVYRTKEPIPSCSSLSALEYRLARIPLRKVHGQSVWLRAAAR